MKKGLPAMRWLFLKYHPARVPYLKYYPPNTIWRGYLSNIAIAELELVGNTVKVEGDHYILNATAPPAPITTKLVAAMREQTCLEVF